MLVDHATLTVCSGKGGDGSNNLHHAKGVAKGGPDGGDGGNGGDVVLVGDPHLDTLASYARRRLITAEDGEKGRKKACYGKRGETLELPLPLGCQVFDTSNDELLVDVISEGQRFMVAAGGKGGRGNIHFATPTHQTPREFEEGGEPVELEIRLELKLIADIGLVGLPNAGKSTMLSRVSKARPKVADYPFTTLGPQLGMIDLPGERRLVVADLPGLIEGAASGAGLGHDFLRHVERTSFLLHLLDAAPPDGSSPADNHRLIRHELSSFSPVLLEKRELIALNKIDLIPEDEREDFIDQMARELGMPEGERPMVVSGATGLGVRELLEACWSEVQNSKNGGLKSDSSGWGVG
jgi:GTP-binding protein